MTKDDEKELKKLIGMTVTHIKEMPIFYFDAQWTLTLECPWRLILNEESILVGHYEFDAETTHEASLKKLRDHLVGKRMTDLFLEKGIRDLYLAFEGNLQLHIFPTSSQYESWNLNLENRNFIGVPGGKVVVIRRNDS